MEILCPLFRILERDKDGPCISVNSLCFFDLTLCRGCRTRGLGESLHRIPDVFCHSLLALLGDLVRVGDVVQLGCRPERPVGLGEIRLGTLYPIF